MPKTPNRFAKNDIMSLTAFTPRYDLAESIGPDLHVRDLLTEEGFGDLADVALSYGTAAGDPGLRKAVANAHDVEPDDVVITIGGMHSLFLIAFILCEPGDEVVTTTPLFPNSTNALRSIGADVKTLSVTFDNGYRIDVEALSAQLSPATKLVGLASPQNPSGVAIDDATLRAILDVMASRCPDAYLLVDETYREAVYGDGAIAASAVHLDPRVISCASLSKCHGAPGLRLGWAVSRDTAMMEQMILGKFNTVIACSRIDEALALRVYERQDEIMAVRRRQLADGLARTSAWFESNSALVEWVRPDAGALCCGRLKPSAFDDAGVARFYAALERHDVRVADGAWFGEESRVFRLGFGLLPMPEFEAGLDALSAALHDAVRTAA